jgi:hypothetical protein
LPRAAPPPLGRDRDLPPQGGPPAGPGGVRKRRAAPPGVRTASFGYDALSRRFSKTISSTTTKYLFDGANIVQELQSGSVTANELTDLGIDQSLTRSVVGGSTSTVLPDALGSSVALADSSGTVQTSYTYEPFRAASSSGSANSNPFQYTGRENDGPDCSTTGRAITARASSDLSAKTRLGSKVEAPTSTPMRPIDLPVSET